MFSQCLNHLLSDIFSVTQNWNPNSDGPLKTNSRETLYQIHAYMFSCFCFWKCFLSQFEKGCFAVVIYIIWNDKSLEAFWLLYLKSLYQFNKKNFSLSNK